VTGDTCSRIGTRQADLPQLSDTLGNEDWDNWIYVVIEETKTECVMKREED
jgi:hypothetical protein